MGAVTVALGKRRYLYGTTREEVAHKVTAALSATQQGIPLPADTETIERFLARWLSDTAATRVRPRTLANYEGLIRLHVVPELGKVRLNRLTPAQVQGLLNKKLANGLSPRTVELIRVVLRQALGHALRWNLVARNVAALTDRPRPNRKEVRPLDADQAQRLLAAVRGDRLEALYALALALGPRQGELLGLRWDDVDLDHGLVHIRRSLARLNGAFTLSELKTTRSMRTLGPLPEAITATLRAHKSRQTEERLAAAAWDDWGLVFTTPVGSPLHSRTVTKAFQAHLDRSRAASAAVP